MGSLLLAEIKTLQCRFLFHRKSVITQLYGWCKLKLADRLTMTSADLYLFKLVYTNAVSVFLILKPGDTVAREGWVHRQVTAGCPRERDGVGRH